jgi:nucleotide-binding universal stress UspA family protein
MKILLPVDGSGQSDRAAQQVIALLKNCGKHEVHVINVQPPIDAPEVRSHMTAGEIEAMQETRGGDALASARTLFEQAGIACTPAVLLGPVAESIVKYAADNGCHKIVMGTRGLGAIGNVLMGSVATQVLHLTTLPVTLVK